MLKSYPFALKTVSILFLSTILNSFVHAAPLKTMSWNIEWFPGNRPNSNKEEQEKQIKEVSEILSKESPDIFIAQEISSKDPFDRIVAAVPGLKTHVVSAFVEPDDKLSGQQCAIASKLEADSAWFEEFKPTETLPSLRRGFAFAALKHPDGGLIMVYCVHLKSNRGSETEQGAKDVANTRKESVKLILAHKAQMEKKFADRKILGWLVGGDFNTNHDNQFTHCTVISDFTNAGFHNTWQNTPKEERHTWRPKPFVEQFNPTTFDYIITSGFKNTDAKLVADIPVEVSDHAAMFIKIELE